ncbi:MAG: AAA family ATPase [Sandaracinaceae bacterium]|nr:AAA family ATPase [Sandaracinaceae bacterium]
MLTCLRVRHLAIIDQLEVELGPGLNVITGETGAGKSILIDALSLVLGERARPELVRTGAKQAEVEALFDIGDDPEALARLEGSGIDADGELVVRRVIGANGRTRAYLNGSLASAGQLAEIARGLVDISSQHEHHTLVDPGTHLGYLDAFGRLEPLRDEVADAHRALAEADLALREAEQAAASRGEREDLLRFQIREIDELDPKVGEDAELAEERERLRHAERLAKSAGGAEEELYAEDGAVCEVLGRIAGEVRAAASIDARLAPLADAIEGAATQLEEAARELGAYARDVTMDPERQAEVEDRLARLKRLARKYGGDVAGILAHREAAAAELEALSRAEERVLELEAAREAALSSATSAARALSARRRTIADELARRISEELASLGMGGARVEVQVRRWRSGAASSRSTARGSARPASIAWSSSSPRTEARSRGRSARSRAAASSRAPCWPSSGCWPASGAPGSTSSTRSTRGSAARWPRSSAKSSPTWRGTTRSSASRTSRRSRLRGPALPREQGGGGRAHQEPHRAARRARAPRGDRADGRGPHHRREPPPRGGGDALHRPRRLCTDAGRRRLPARH